jgi:hypothetical protein
MNKSCKYEKKSISPSVPSVIWIRCKHPDFKPGNVVNCIGYDNCADYKIKDINEK